MILRPVTLFPAALYCAVSIGSADAAPGPRASGSAFLDRAFDAGTATSAAVFEVRDDERVAEEEEASGGASGDTARGLSKSTFLLGTGILASAIVVAAWLLRSPEPCRAPLRYAQDARWWWNLVDHQPGDPPPAPPPPSIPVPAPEGCFYGW